MIGHLGRDAEVREVGGQSVIAFTVAHSERFTDRSGVQQDRTTWVNCSYWRETGKTAVAQYLKKGTQVYMEGIPSARAYTNNQQQLVGSLEMRVMSLELLGGKQPGAPGTPQQQGGGYSAPFTSQPQQQGYQQPAQQQPASFNTPDPSLEQGGGFEDDLPF